MLLRRIFCSSGSYWGLDQFRVWCCDGDGGRGGFEGWGEVGVGVGWKKRYRNFGTSFCVCYNHKEDVTREDPRGCFTGRFFFLYPTPCLVTKLGGRGYI